jgi:tetratricopeptide (TPR) repeat protein
VGFMPPADFCRQVADYRAGRGTLATLLAEEGAHRGESAYTIRLADRLYGHGRTEEAIPRYRAVFADGASSEAPRAGFFLARLAARGGRPAEALATVDSILARFPIPEVRMHVTPLEAELSEKLGKPARALAAWKRYVAENPNDAYVGDAKTEIARLEKETAKR